MRSADDSLASKPNGPSDTKRIRIGPAANTSREATLAFSLSSSQTIVAKVNSTWNAKLVASMCEIDGVTTRKTDAVGVEELVVPLRILEVAKTVLKEKHATRMEFSFPPIIVERLRQLQGIREERLKRGDVVTRPLNETLPPSICNALMDFQWEGIHFALRHGGRCLIGDDMGLGKTLQAIAVARIYMEDWPLLIVCPSSLRLNWKEELLRWLEDDIDEDDIHVIMKGSDADRQFRQINIVSYDLFRKIRTTKLEQCKFIIADESHYLKTATAKRTQAVTPLITRCNRALLLSGTPALSRPVELFPQINSLVPVLFPKFSEYAERYCNAHMGRFGYDVSGSSNLNELYELLSGNVLIRRKKDDVLTQLPAKRRQVMWVETKPKIMKQVKTEFAAYEKIKATINRSAGDEAQELRNKERSVQNKLYNLTAEAKRDSILEFIRDTAETGVKFIVFGHHLEALDSIDDFLCMKLKLGYIRIDGKTPQGGRQGMCKRFQEEPDCRVALLSITAAGVGLTLTAATVVLFAELYWNPGSLLQAEDRAHRIGQRDCVLVKYLLGKGTLDEMMWTSVKRKFNVIGKSLTGSAGVIEVASQTPEKRPYAMLDRDDDDPLQMASPEHSQKPLPTFDLTQGNSKTKSNKQPDIEDMFPDGIEVIDVDAVKSATGTELVDADRAYAKHLTS